MTSTKDTNAGSKVFDKYPELNDNHTFADTAITNLRSRQAWDGDGGERAHAKPGEASAFQRKCSGIMNALSMTAPPYARLSLSTLSARSPSTPATGGARDPAEAHHFPHGGARGDPEAPARKGAAPAAPKACRRKGETALAQRCVRYTSGPKQPPSEKAARHCRQLFSAVSSYAAAT